MITKYNINNLLSPGFSKTLEDPNKVMMPATLPVNIFEIQVEEYLARNNVEEPTPFKPPEENKAPLRSTRQPLGPKNNNAMPTNAYSTGKPSFYSASYETRRRPLNSGVSTVNKFGFKH